MKLSEFDFELEHDRIAYYPPKKRGTSKLMVINRAAGTIEHKSFDNFFVEETLSCFDMFKITDLSLSPTAN